MKASNAGLTQLPDCPRLKDMDCSDNNIESMQLYPKL